MSLLSPPANLPAHLVPIWPWIWLQHRMLLAWIRLTYGRGYRYGWRVYGSGRVELIWIDLQSRDRIVIRPVTTPASRRLAAALGDDALMPVFLRTLSSARPARQPRRVLPRTWLSRRFGLPLPDS